MLGVVLLVVLILAGYKAFSIYTMIQGFAAPKPPISVAVATATEQPWQARLPTVGTLKALQGVDLSLETDGTVVDLQFESGQKVKAGQPLLRLDSAVESALLETAQADLGLAQLDYGRGSQLVGSQAISKGEFDRLSAVLKKSKASVNQLKAALGKKSIVAPFSGTIGIRQVDVGDYLASGTMIATLQDLSSLYVDFFVPEQSVPKIAIGQPVEVIVAAYPAETFPGTISAINPKLENSTRNMQVRATLANPDGKLLPGMFASLQVMLPDPQSRIVVPESAITYTLYGNSLYVVAEKSRRRQPGKRRQGPADPDRRTAFHRNRRAPRRAGDDYQRRAERRKSGNGRPDQTGQRCAHRYQRRQDPGREEQSAAR